MDKELLVTNIIKYCSLKGEAPTSACKAAGVGTSFISDIRRGQTPSVSKVADLAAYLGVTTSDLVGDKKDAATLRDSQTELFMNFLGKLTQEQKDALGKVMEAAKDE